MEIYTKKINGYFNLISNLIVMMIFYLLFSIYIPFIFVFSLTVSIISLFVILFLIRNSKDKILFNSIYSIRNSNIVIVLILIAIFFSPVDIIFNISERPAFILIISNNIFQSKLNYFYLTSFTIPFFIVFITILFNQSTTCTWKMDKNQLVSIFSNYFFKKSYQIKLDRLDRIIFPIDNQMESLFYNRKIALFIYKNKVKRQIPFTLNQFNYIKFRYSLEFCLNQKRKIKYSHVISFTDRMRFNSLNQHIHKKNMKISNFDQLIGESRLLPINYVNKYITFTLILVSFISLFLNYIFIISLLSIFNPNLSYFYSEPINNASLAIIIIGLISTTIIPSKYLKKSIIRIVGKSYLKTSNNNLIIFIKIARINITEFVIPLSIVNIINYDKYFILDTGNTNFKIIKSEITSLE